MRSEDGVQDDEIDGVQRAGAQGGLLEQAADSAEEALVGPKLVQGAVRPCIREEAAVYGMRAVDGHGQNDEHQR